MSHPKNEQPTERIRPRPGLIGKFQTAAKGIVWGATGQTSFAIHGVAALVVIVAGVIAGLGVDRWCLVLMCIGAVMAAEMFNSALESVCRSITNQFDPHVQRALDIASGAVLIVAITAAIAGMLIFGDAVIHFGSRNG